MVEQVSVFLENQAGRLARMTRVLGDAGYNLRALMVADTSAFGVVRMLCDRPRAAAEVLERNGFAASVTNVIAVEIPDVPGGLADVLETLDGAGINVEYAYCFIEPSGDAAVDIFRVEDPARAVGVLEAVGVTVVPAEKLYEPD